MAASLSSGRRQSELQLWLLPGKCFCAQWFSGLSAPRVQGMVYSPMDAEVHVPWFCMLHTFKGTDRGRCEKVLNSSLNKGSVLRPESRPGCSYLGTAVPYHTLLNPTLHPQKTL